MMRSSVVRILLTASMLLPTAVSSLAPGAAQTSAASRSPLFRSPILQSEQRIRAATPWSSTARNQRSFLPFFSATRRTNTHHHNMQESFLSTTAAAATTSSTALSSISSSTLNIPVPRGGGGGGLSALGGLAVTAFGKFSAYIGASKTRCLIVLLCSILLESYATALSKQAKDTGKLVVFLHACALYLLCMVGFNISLAKIDVSVAYALWGAIGTILVTAAGFLFFGESLDMVKVICLVMIMTGVVGLNLRG